MRFLTLEHCSDSELHCIYHDPERTITLLHPHTACSLHLYAPEKDHHTAVGVYHSRRPNNAHSWWLQQLGITASRLLGIADSVVGKAIRAIIKSNSTNEIGRERIRNHLMNLRAVIPHPDVLDEEELIRTIRPLPYPWSFPSNMCYREAKRGRLAFLTESLVVQLVTDGILLANDFGIRWAHLDQYILHRLDDAPRQPRLQKLDLSALRRTVIRRPGLHDEPNGVEDDRPGIPIIELDNDPYTGMGKRVRLFAKKICVSTNEEETVVRVEDLDDNEGKSAEWQGERRSGRAKRQKMRSKICWDSDCGF